jgi:hypothetical protein
VNNVVEEIVKNLDINSVEKEGVVIQQGEKAEKISDNATDIEIALTKISGSINKRNPWYLDSVATRHVIGDRGKL